MGLAKSSAIHSRRNLLIAVVIAAAYCASPHSALAVQSGVYSNFTKCPTSAPAMNEPANAGAACVAGAINRGSIKVGNFSLPITSPLRFQFAFVAGGEEVHIVEDSTSFEAQPFLIPNPFAPPPSQVVPPGLGQVPSSAPRKKFAPTKKRHKKSKCKKTTRGRGKGKCKRHGHGHKKSKKNRNREAQMPSANQANVSSAASEGGSMIEISPEAAGEIRALELSAFAGEPGTAFELPLKLHLQGAGLGPACYIGSDSEPIVLAPEAVSIPTTLQFGMDPNGFNVKLLGIRGVSLEDGSFTVPGASGCGGGALDAAISSLVGLPAAEGASNALLADVAIEIATAEYDGTPPDGGAELQAAFEAAQ